MPRSSKQKVDNNPIPASSTYQLSDNDNILPSFVGLMTNSPTPPDNSRRIAPLGQIFSPITPEDFISQYATMFPNSPLPIFSQPNPIPQPSQNTLPSPHPIPQPSQTYFPSPNPIPQPSQTYFQSPNTIPQPSQSYFSSQYETNTKPSQPSQFNTPQPSQCYTPQPSQQTQTNAKTKAKGKQRVVVKREGDSSKNWDPEEDVALCDIVSNVSDRPKQQRKPAFWKIIVGMYNEAMKHHPMSPREERSLQNRWANLKKVSIAWKAATARVERENRSGENQLDAYTRKIFIYNGIQKGKDPWHYEHIEHHLLNFSRYSWRTTDGAYKTFDDVCDISSPGVSSQGSAKRSNPFDDDDDDDDDEDDKDEDEDEAPNAVSSPVKIISRPEGVKKTKAKAKAARDIFYDSESSIAHAEKIAEARRLEAQADMARTEYARERFALKHQLKQRQQDENYLNSLYARAKTEDDFAHFSEVQKKFNAKYWS